MAYKNCYWSKENRKSLVSFLAAAAAAQKTLKQCPLRTTYADDSLPSLATEVLDEAKFRTAWAVDDVKLQSAVEKNSFVQSALLHWHGDSASDYKSVHLQTWDWIRDDETADDSSVSANVVILASSDHAHVEQL